MIEFVFAKAENNIFSILKDVVFVILVLVTLVSRSKY